MSEESSCGVGLSVSKEITEFSGLNTALSNADAPFSDLRGLTKSISVEGSDVVYFEEIVRASLEGKGSALKTSGKPKQKKPSLDELKSFYSERAIHRNTMRVDLKVLKTLEVPWPQDASGLIINNTDLEHTVEKRLGVLAEEQMTENFPLNDAFSRSKLIINDRDHRSSVSGCKGTYCEYVFNAMSLLAKKSFSKCLSHAPLHRAVLFRIPRKWIDEDKQDMLLSTSPSNQRLSVESKHGRALVEMPTDCSTLLPSIQQGSGCVGSPIKQKKAESPAAYLLCRSSAASYDVLNVCENCFKIYGALHNIKKNQEYQKKNGISSLDHSAVPFALLSLSGTFPPAAKTGSSLLTPEQKTQDLQADSGAVAKYTESLKSDQIKSPPPNSSSSSPIQNAVKGALSTSPVNRTRRKGILGASTNSDLIESADQLPRVDMNWRIKNFSQKLEASPFGASPHVYRGESRNADLDCDIHTAEEHPENGPVPIPVRDQNELTRMLQYLDDRSWDDAEFQRELKQDHYYFDLCKSWDSMISVLVTVERELKLMTPKHVLGLMAVNLKMPGFVNFSLMKPTYNAEKKPRQ
jgi:hypothetical protein